MKSTSGRTLEPQIYAWQIAWDKAVSQFTFLRAIEENANVSVSRAPTAVELQLLDERFLSKRLDAYRHPMVGSGEFELYVVDEMLRPRRVDIRRGQSITYPAENMLCEGASSVIPPSDVEELGETIGEALQREVALPAQFVAVIQYSGSRQLSAQIGMSADVMKRVVQVFAYQLWERRGKPTGDDLTDWLTATKELRIPIDLQDATPTGSLRRSESA
jgi:hypothetical protein